MLQSFVTVQQPFIPPEFQILQSTTTTTSSFNLLNYGAIPTEPWGWIDFSMGLIIGGYFPVRDHIEQDCYSGIYHTASLLMDTSKAFNQALVTSIDWTLWAIDPFIATLIALKSIN